MYYVQKMKMTCVARCYLIR